LEREPGSTLEESGTNAVVTPARTTVATLRDGFHAFIRPLEASDRDG
jgi:hypothetical protein